MYHLAGELLQPFLLLSLLLGSLLVYFSWKRRAERRRFLALTILFFLLLLCFTPAVSYLALGSLEWPYPPLERRPDDARAIVVLSGYVRPAAELHRRYELGEDTLYRCLRAAELYRQGPPCPILVSGGKVNPDAAEPACAPVMRDFLVQCGVATSDVIVEDQSTTTWENAVASCRLLEERGIGKIILVTDAAHLARAVRCFRKLGIDPVPCGCRYRAVRLPWEWAEWLPNPAGGRGLQEACHEWLGMTWYWLRGRI